MNKDEVAVVEKEKVFSIAKLKKSVDGTLDVAKEIIDELYDENVVKDARERYENATMVLEDVKSFEIINKTYKNVRDMRIEIDKKRKEISQPMTDFNSGLIAHAKTYIEECTSVEDVLKAKIKEYEDLEEAKKQRLYKKRLEELVSSGWSVTGQFLSCGVHSILAKSLEVINEETFKENVEIGKSETKKQAELKAKEDAEKKELERLKEELAKKERELKEREQALKVQEIPQQKEEVKKEVEQPKETPQPHQVEGQTEVKQQTKGATVPIENTFLSGFYYARKELFEFAKVNENLDKKAVIDFLKSMTYKNYKID